MDGAVYLTPLQLSLAASALGTLTALLIFLLKYWFDRTNKGIAGNDKKLDRVMEELREEIQRNYEKTSERINHIEEKTNQDIAELRQDMNDLKGDFATTFVQRDDFFRYMNGMEANIKDTNSKVDKILMLITDRRGGSGTQ
ncbi:MAG: hypothetical protein OSJ72_19475 [Lachnospiraceae bacterium]|nr:hypothetical protein [Lachnospiraceae bacterium]